MRFLSSLAVAIAVLRLARSNSTNGTCGRKAAALSLNSTFVYDLDNLYVTAPIINSEHGVDLNAQVYIIDAQTTPQEHIDAYHNAGKTVICYFSAGSWEPKRPDYANFPPECYCGPGVDYNKTDGICSGPDAKKNMLDGWPEWYLDIHNPDCYKKVQDAQMKRIQSFIDKGCDGLDPDNVDAYSNVQQHGITEEDEIKYILWLSRVARTNNLLVDLKNAGSLLVNDTTGIETKWARQLLDSFDFVVLEECIEQNNCWMYDMFLNAGKPEILIEYVGVEGDNFTLDACPCLRDGQHLLVYETNTLNATHITLECNDSA